MFAILEKMAIYIAGRDCRIITVSGKCKRVCNINNSVDVIANGIDVKRINDKVSRSSIRSNERKCINICMIANVNFLKGHDLLLKALQEREDYACVSIFCIGKLLPENNVYMRRLRALHEELKGTSHVEFLGFGDEELITDILSISDFGLLSSRSEAFPFAILEYMAAGLPIIAPDVGDISTMVSIENRKYIFKPNDVLSLKYSLESLLSLPKSKRSAIGLANLDKVRRYIWIEAFFK